MEEVPLPPENPNPLKESPDLAKRAEFESRLERYATMCRHGSNAALISAAVTFLVVALAVFTGAGAGAFAVWNDPLNFIDVGLILLCAWGMRRKSRAAAVVIFFYFLIAKIYLALISGQISGMIGGLIFLFFYGRAVYGSFMYHRLRKGDDPAYKAAGKWTYYAGIPAVLLLFVMMVIGMLMDTGFVPDLVLVPGDEVSASMEAELRDNEILMADESIEYLYASGMFSVLEGGTILSDRAVIGYFQDEQGEIQVYDIAIPDIEKVEFVQQQSDFVEHTYRLSGADGYWISVILPTEEEGYNVFLEALQELRDSARSGLTE